MLTTFITVCVAFLCGIFVTRVLIAIALNIYRIRERAKEAEARRQYILDNNRRPFR